MHGGSHLLGTLKNMKKVKGRMVERDELGLKAS